MPTYTVPRNSIQTNVVGWTFDDNNETWIVPLHVTVSSTETYGFINNNYADDTLENQGTVATYAQVAAVYFDTNSGNATVLNEAGGTISGARNGIDFYGSGNQLLDNRGTIIGVDNNAVFFGHPTLEDSVVNRDGGYIFGASYGVEIASYNAGGTIENFGTIKGGATPPRDNPSYQPAAISLFTEPTIVTDITNETGGIIDGAVDAIYANTGEFNLVNNGSIFGNIVSADGSSDVITNRGKIKGAVFLEGNSVFRDVRGGTSGAIHLGDGNATVTGGPGIDRFVFDSPITDQVTTITNFQHGVDKIVLSKTEFTALSAGGIHHLLRKADFHVGPAEHPWQHIVYAHARGILCYDPSGSNGPEIEIAHFTNDATITYADILISA
jgi:hypothetical protein